MRYLAVAMLAVQLRLLNEEIFELDRKVRGSARATDVDRRLIHLARPRGIEPLFPP